MNEHIAKLSGAFALGMAASAGLVQIVKVLPLHRYVKQALRVVLPIPAIAIALVMLYYNPDALPESPGEAGFFGDMIRMFFFGAASALLYVSVLAILRMVQSKHKEGHHSSIDA